MLNNVVLKLAVLSCLCLLFAKTTSVHGQLGMGGGGMGGMGGGMGGMGGGGMGPFKTPLQLLQEEVAKKPETWSRPVGEEPAWLKNGKTSVEATEALRAQLNRTITIGTADDFQGSKKLVKQECGIDIELNRRALEDANVPFDHLPAIPAGTGPLREHLRRMLEPLQLAYRVCEGYIEITSQEEAEKSPATRFYDLGYVMRDNASLPEVINAIYTSVDPDSWDLNGGSCTCIFVGQILVVRNSENNHLEIERLLARLAVNQAPADRTDK